MCVPANDRSQGIAGKILKRALFAVAVIRSFYLSLVPVCQIHSIMLKVQDIFKILLLATTLYNCSGTSQKNKQDFVKANIIIENKNLDDSINHGLTIDLDYEKYPREKLKPIVEIFLKINSTKNWTTVKEVDLNNSTEGGNATYYFEGGELRKLISKNYGETGKNIKEYYLDKNKLIFVYETAYNYNRPIYFDSAKMKELNDTETFDITKSEILEDRSYFENGILIHQSNNQDCGSPFAQSYLREEQKRIKQELKSLTNLVNLQE